MFSQEVVVDHDSGELIPAVVREITPAVVSALLGLRDLTRESLLTGPCR